MSRPPVEVRRAQGDDVDDLVLLWSQAREEAGGATRAVTSGAVGEIHDRLRHAIDGSDALILFARWEGRPAGYAVLRAAPLMSVVDDESLHVEHLFVAAEHRRHGVAKALLGAITTVAERQGIEQVVVNSPPASRETHRFLARLGFTPLVVRRIASTTALRRRLAGDSHRGGLEDLLHRRRSLRARAEATPADGISADLGELGPRLGVSARLRAQALRARRIDLEADLVAALETSLDPALENSRENSRETGREVDCGAEPRARRRPEGRTGLVADPALAHDVLG